MIWDVVRKKGIDRVRVFGSYARGEAGFNSDLDLILDCPPEVSLMELVRIQLDLEDALMMRVDVFSHDGISPYIADEVEREAIDI